MTSYRMSTRSLLIAILMLAASGYVLAQTTPYSYDAKWRTVDSLINKKNLPASALTEVKAIYTRASQEKNDPQIIKSLLYRIRLQDMGEDDAALKSIAQLDSGINIARQPARAILESIRAGLYWEYYQTQRYKILQRTATTGITKNDPATWGAADFHKKIGALFLSSIRDEQLLRQTSIQTYDPIIVKGNTRKLRPTLFDLLANRALDYFKTGEGELDRPANAFEIADTIAFAPARVFADHIFRTTDSLSLQWTALQLYQRLIKFHLNDTRPDALIDVDIDRLGFVHANAVGDRKEDLYIQALTGLTDRYANEPAVAEAWYLQARQYANKAATYDPLADTSNRYGYIKAKNICEKVIAQKDSSEGSIHCKMLLHEINNRSLSFQTEKITIPGQPFLSLITWRNISGLNFRVIAIDKKIKTAVGTQPYRDTWWKDILSLPVLKTFSQQLPANTDYQQHRVQIKIDPLPAGEYMIIASASPSFDLDNNPIAMTTVYVSSIAWINSGHDYFVVDRGSGRPLPDADVQVWNKSYNNKTQQYQLTAAETYRSDANGYFMLKDRISQPGNTQTLLEIRTANDRLFPDNAVTFYNYDELATASQQKKDTLSFLFTDRAIYRPGQPVYFKGILLEKDLTGSGTSILSGFHTKLILYDANHSKLDSLLLTSNEFGSYNGQFRLPEGFLNGEFQIEDSATGKETAISVEEYKRPKFYVEYEKVKGSHRLDDSIRINGIASAYAGNNIDGAKVKYRVVRQARYPWYFTRRRPVSVNTQEIAHGETKTDAGGRFSILFTALPDRLADQQSDPVFEYTVSADITDINGETRSGETLVRVGYTTLELSFQTPVQDNLPADSLTTMAVTAASLSGDPVPALVHLSIYRLQGPDRLLHDRYWEQPDQFVMSKEEFIKTFPHDLYADETNKAGWNRIGKVFESTDSAGKALRLRDGSGKPFPNGWYLVEASSKDRYGKEASITRYIALTDAGTGAPAHPVYSWTSDDSQTTQPGQQAQVNTGSSTDVYVIRKIDRTGPGLAPQPYQFLTLNNNRKTSSIPISEKDRGGLGVLEIFVKDNREYRTTHTINVPWSNKELSIQYGSFRDKTLPGSGESWKIKIAAENAGKLMAEVLAAMYDASLDQFRKNEWSIPDIYPRYAGGNAWATESCFGSAISVERFIPRQEYLTYNKEYDALMADLMAATRRGLVRGRVMPMTMRIANAVQFKAKQSAGSVMLQVPDAEIDPDGSKGLLRDGYSIRLDSGVAGFASSALQRPSSDQSAVQTRKNLNETAFFFPDLHTDAAGNLDLSFTMPEALTKWRMMLLAHTKDLSFGYSEKTVLTQKQLMVQPNMPRFLREGDRMELAVKVVNLTDSEMTGQMELQLTDPTTGQTADGLFTNRQPNQYFTVGAGQSAVVSFPIDIPFQYNRPLTWRVMAHARAYSDGEEATLPVVSNRMLVTESLPLSLPGDGTRSFKFEKLLASGNSETLNHHALTVEFTSNPAWYAVQALPYLMEYPYECAEQTFNRFYANALASKIVSSSPRIQQIFSKWKEQDTSALLSNLEKNQELKSILLEETPWVLQGKSETQQKKNIALLFDMVRMSRQLESTLSRLADMQSDGGGFVWFKGGPDDRYITQYILTGIAHLQKLNALPLTLSEKIQPIVDAALPYLDGEIRKDYEEILRQQKTASASPKGALSNASAASGKPTASGPSGNPAASGNPILSGQSGMPSASVARSPKPSPSIRPGGSPAASGKPARPAGIRGPKIPWIGDLTVQYLYMRSMFTQGIPGDVFPAVNYFRKQAQQSWQDRSPMQKGMIALALQHTGDIKTAKDIMASLRETAIRDEEKGMYWKGMEGGYYWYQAPIETQSLLIEAFHTISPDAGIDRDCKTWLLRQKQTHSWSTTKATADACYALLLDGTEWLTAERAVTIHLGDKTAGTSDAGAEAGTGYFKKVFDAPFINPSMGNITVTVATTASSATGKGHTETPAAATASTAARPTAKTGLPAWGAVYWQYFDNLDKITSAETARSPLRLSKKLFVQHNTDRGVVLEPVEENAALHPGDRLTVRIELRSDRDLEYVHMKDMRAACMEPVNVISDYKWQGGLGYYETTKDASTEFFFSYLPKGTFVFEYPLFVGQMGSFSNGVTSIECMYAPEFSFHSEGIRVNVETPTP